MPKVGDALCYRALAGDVYAAEVTDVRADGSVDIRCFFPGTASTQELRRIRFSLEPTRDRMAAWPRDERQESFRR